MAKTLFTHKNKIPSGGISQIDSLESGKITYEYPSLLVVRKFSLASYSLAIGMSLTKLALMKYK